MSGAFTQYRALDYSEQKLFDELYGDLQGVKYTVFAVSTQVVSKAINYKFLCSKQLVLPEALDPVIVILSYTKVFADSSASVAKLDEVELKA